MYLCTTLRNYRWLNYIGSPTWNQQSSTVTSPSEIVTTLLLNPTCFENFWVNSKVSLHLLGSKPPTLAAQKPLFSWLTSPSLMVKSSYIHIFAGFSSWLSHHFLWQNKKKSTASITTFHGKQFKHQHFSPGEVPSQKPPPWLPPAPSDHSSDFPRPGRRHSPCGSLRCYVSFFSGDNG